jgi:hypothetical protein
MFLRNVIPYYIILVSGVFLSVANNLRTQKWNYIYLI